MVWEIETRVNGQVVTFLVRPLQLPVAYMKANPEINSFNFSILLPLNTKCATTTLLSTFGEPDALVGVSDFTESHVGSLVACCRANFGAAGFSVGNTYTYYPEHMSPEETG